MFVEIVYGTGDVTRIPDNRLWDNEQLSTIAVFIIIVAEIEKKIIKKIFVFFFCYLKI